MKQFANYSILFLVLFCTIIAYVVKGKVDKPNITTQYNELIRENETLRYQLNQCKVLLRGPNP